MNRANTTRSSKPAPFHTPSEQATSLEWVDHHRVGLGSHSLTAMGFPGYNAFPPESGKSVAQHMQKAGFINYAIGKWDHTPLDEVSEAGPFARWPSGEGFDHYYGYMAADADDVWELYHIDEDFSEAVNVAEQHPEKLEALKKRWDELAWENNVYPLYDDMIQRVAKQQGRLFGDRTEFVYFDPGARRIAEKASPPVKGALYINGEKVDEVDMPRMHVSSFSLSETFDVGIDSGTPVSNKYRVKNHYPYSGQLDKVVVRLTDL